MQNISFNEGWMVRKGVADPFEFVGGQGAAWKSVTLPHDGLIGEERDPAAASGKQSGYYPAGAFTYAKTFFAPAEWEGKTILLEFEGVMARALVYVNGAFACASRCGYTQFYADLAPLLKYGAENTVKVVASLPELASRWYAGCGIYRPVTLHLGADVCIPPEGVRITTECADRDGATLSVGVTLTRTHEQNGAYHVRLRALDRGQCAGECDVPAAFSEGQKTHIGASLLVRAPRLWSPEHPNLYTLEVCLMEGETVLDAAEERFGIRTLSLDAERGLCINGEHVDLRGACIHHDNGILGAAAMEGADAFRAKKLKEAGFNAIRSAHNPLGKQMLRACDALGILVMDELSDVWNEPKNANDLSFDFADCWRTMCERMVGKDYNHPCVILYCVGNEIPEIGRPSGAAMNRAIVGYLRSLDATRYLTNAINGYLAAADRLAQFSAPQPAAGEGSEQMNAMMGQSEQALMDAFAVSDLLTDCIEPVARELDVVGFNYLTARHEKEKEWHPGRIVVGSETYPTEIARLWRIVRENAHVIGDFTWTGYDYIGEAGIGICHYNAETRAQGWYPDRLAYTGDLDLTGWRRPISYLREIVYGLRTAPYLAVFRPEHAGETCDESRWKYHDVLESWTYPGYEGKQVRVLVLSPSEEVELRLNGSAVARKKVGEEARSAFFTLPYVPGTLEAVGYTQGAETGRFALATAGAPTQLLLSPSTQKLPARERGVSFIVCELADEKGVVNRNARRLVRVGVTGAGTLAGFGSASPNAEGNYTDSAWETYDGRVMAAVRAGAQAGECTVRFTAGALTKEIVLTIV